jgi:hypothetical protein
VGVRRGEDDEAMLVRFLYSAQGKVRLPRLIGLLVVTISLAIFGSFLLALTPTLSGHELVQTVWVFFAVCLLKMPLIGLLWWFIVRNKEWPVKPPKWSERESREILDYLVAEAERCRDLPDAPARLSYLRGEAWNVADRVEGDVKLDAVSVAVHIDQMAAQPARSRRRPLA